MGDEVGPSTLLYTLHYSNLMSVVIRAARTPRTAPCCTSHIDQRHKVETRLKELPGSVVDRDAKAKASGTQVGEKLVWAARVEGGGWRVKGARAAQGYVSGGRLAGATTGGTKRNDEPCKRSPLGPRPSRLSSAHSHHSQHSMLHAPCSLLPAGLGWAGLGLLATRQSVCPSPSGIMHCLHYNQ
jgi:hypothetical protein